MPVRRIASIKAGREIKKRKFVSPCFHEANAGWYTGCSAPSAMAERKIRQGKQFVVSRRRATIARRHSSVGSFR
jgi:hypothetical protein